MVLAVPVPGQFITGVDATAAFLNSNVHDAVTFLTNPPICACYPSTAQAISASTWTALTMNVNKVDSYSGHSTTTNTSRYVAQVAGWYSVTGTSSLVTSTMGAVDIAINGTRVIGTVVGSATVAGPSLSTGQTTAYCFLNAGDYVETYVFSNTAANTEVSGADFQCSMQVLWIHA